MRRLPCSKTKLRARAAQEPAQKGQNSFAFLRGAAAHGTRDGVYRRAAAEDVVSI
jgi:hypothetical protein